MRSKRARGAAVLAAVLMLAAACGETVRDEPGAEPGVEPGVEPKKAPSSSAPADPTVAPVVDERYAVDAPGPRKGAVVSADMLITSAEPLTAEVVDGVKGLEGVTDVAVLSIGQALVENRSYNLAAVDASFYRRFTERASADFQEQWDRVAGGELAVSDTLEKKLPLDDEGFLKLSAAEDAQTIHVGAYAPQIPTVDGVVNAKWGEALGLPEGNAMVVSTTQVSPQSLRKPVERIAGEGTSVQLMDAATLSGIDTDAFQTVNLVGNFADAVGVFNYTVIGGGRIAPEPSWVSQNIATAQVPILGSVTCNKAMMPQLQAALAEIAQLGLADEINPGEYAGCYYPRFIAGSTTLSNHSFGLAFDINVPGNQRGTVGEIDRGVVAVFKKWGFGWGGDWSYTDPMHFELSRIVNPG